MQRIVLLGCLAALLPSLSGCSEAGKVSQRPHADMAELQAFVGRDLRELDEAANQSLRDSLGDVMPKLPVLELGFSPQPWYLWRRESSGVESGYILFAGQSLISIPGISSATNYLLDVSGELLGSTSFSTGWRIDLESASLRHEPELGQEVIEVLTRASINGVDVRRQVYGIVGTRIALLRLEDSDGTTLANNYYNPNHTIGPAPPQRSLASWEEAFASDDPAVVLEALTFVGGRHRTNLTLIDASIAIEDLDSAQLVAEIRGSEKVQAAIRALSESENPWLKDAAILAQQQIAEDTR